MIDNAEKFNSKKMPYDIKEINERLIERIKFRMNEIGINARQLAERAKVGKSFVYDILNGKSKNPTSNKLNLISKELGVSIAYLMSANEEINYDKYVPVYGGMENKGDLKALLSKSFCLENFIQGENLYTHRMDDDSMDPTILYNDHLIIQSKVNSFRSGLYLINDKTTQSRNIRRMENIIGSTKVKIIPDNSKYSVYVAEISELDILGRVILLIKGC